MYSLSAPLVVYSLVVRIYLLYIHWSCIPWWHHRSCIPWWWEQLFSLVVYSLVTPLVVYSLMVRAFIALIWLPSFCGQKIAIPSRGGWDVAVSRSIMVVYRYCIVGPRRCTCYIIIYIYIYIVTIGSLLNFLDCSILGLFLEVSSSCYVWMECFLQNILQAGDYQLQLPVPKPRHL